MASIGIFGDPVTPTQYFGYSIALGGLVYYKLGGESLQQVSTQTRLAVGNFRRDHPGRTKAITFGITLLAMGLIAWFWFPKGLFAA